MKTIKWGIIGCGDVCEVKSGPAFYTCENSQLTAVMRRNAEKAEDFAKRHNVTNWYSDAEHLIHNPDVDVVYVATPPSTHVLYTVSALKAGKPVYVEKPMAVNYNECLEMNRTAEETGQKLWVAYYRRSLPYFLKVKELIDENAIGKIHSVNTFYFRPPEKHDAIKGEQPWRLNKGVAGGGYFYDMAPHTIDILMFLLGNISEAKGFTGNIGKLYDVEDTVSASFLFDSGIVGSGLWSYASSPSTKKDITEIFGEKGSIHFSTFAFTPIEAETKDGIRTFDIPSPRHIQQPMIQSIVDELNGVGKCPSDGISGARTSWVIDKIFGLI